MAVTKFQQDYWGNQFDNIPAPVDSDIPYGTGVGFKSTPEFKQGIDRDTYIRLMAEKNPNVDAKTPQARKIEGALMNRGGSTSGDDSFLSYATAPFLAPIKGAIGMAADAYVDSEVEDQYFRETGEHLPAQQIYQMMENKDPSMNTNQALGLERTEEQLREGAEPIGDPSVSPSGTLATMNKNIISGVGTSTGSVSQPTLPKPPDPKQVEKKAFSEYGKAVSFDQNKIPEWYNSHSFSAGLISFGLNLLSGNDLATSFNAASNLFMNTYGEEKRSIWAQDLAAQGFDATEIEQWVRTGDSKVLTKPEEKRMKQIQMETSLAQLDNLQYANSPEMRKYKLEQDQFDRELKLEGLNLQRQRLAQNADNQRAMLALRQEAAQNKMSMTEFKLRGELIQSQAVAAQRAETIAAGRDLLNDPDLELVGSTVDRKVARGASDMFGDSRGVNLNSKIDHYNNKLTNLGNANLYLEAGGNRIFAKEMENAAKNFVKISVDMTPTQIRNALAKNEQVTSRLDQMARSMAETGQHLKASEVSYGTPQYATAAPTQYYSFDPSQVKISR